jgi:hypothetical protein
VRCPQCGADVKDGSTFCDRCDAILDQSFLGTGKEEELFQTTQKPAPKRKSADEATQETVDQLGLFLKNLSAGRKLALGAAVAAVVFACFPWAVLPGEGSVAGLELGSVWVIIAAAVFGGLLVAETSGSLPPGSFPARHYTSVQLGLMALVLLFCIYRFIHPADVGEDTRLLRAAGADARASIQAGLPLTAAAAVSGIIGILLPHGK